MAAVVTIDPNVRVDKNRTYAGFEDISNGPAHLDDVVRVRVDETDLMGDARIVEVDWNARLIYLDVNWSSIAEPKPARAAVQMIVSEQEVDWLSRFRKAAFYPANASALRETTAPEVTVSTPLANLR